MSAVRHGWESLLDSATPHGAPSVRRNKWVLEGAADQKELTARKSHLGPGRRFIGVTLKHWHPWQWARLRTQVCRGWEEKKNNTSLFVFIVNFMLRLHGENKWKKRQNILVRFIKSSLDFCWFAQFCCLFLLGVPQEVASRAKSTAVPAGSD